jgi:murein DD-endopeptidase MepM/ murein hydrolase activator NlpD
MRWGRMLEGIDIAVASGTPVHPAAGGCVLYAGWLGGATSRVG